MLWHYIMTVYFYLCGSSPNKFGEFLLTRKSNLDLTL